MEAGSVKSGKRGAGPITFVTLCVCTCRRRELFSQFTRSLEKLIVPSGVRFHLCVSDNNIVSHHELYIRDLLESLRFASSYGHEPSPGYSNARNKALELALKTPAELIAFVDDDMTVDPTWLLGHLRSHEEFACEVVGGAIHGRRSRYDTGRRVAHGQERRTIGTSNVSFRRWIAADDGLRLRFDPRFNASGGEDKDFFSSAHRNGARIVVSRYPIVHDSTWSQDAELWNRAQVSSIMHRDRIVRLRTEVGFFAGFVGAIWGVRFGIKSLPVFLDYQVSLLSKNADRALRKQVSAYKNFQKMVQGFKGLRGNYIARHQMRRSF